MTDQEARTTIKLTQWALWNQMSPAYVMRAFRGDARNANGEVLLSLLKYPPPDDLQLTTAVCNQAKWTTYRQRAETDRQVAAEEEYKQEACTRPTIGPDPSLRELAEETRLEYLKVELDKVIVTLPREYRIVLRSLLKHDLVQANAAKELGVTRERVRQVYEKILEWMRRPFRREKLEPLLEFVDTDGGDAIW